MKTWLRLTLVVVLVGGGFVDLAAGTEQFSTLVSKGIPGQILFCLLILLALFELVAGLLLVHDSEHRALLRSAIALQIPWISSPIIRFQLICGFGACFWLRPGLPELDGLSRYVGWRWQIGGFETLGLGGQAEWNIGLNFVALLLFFLVPAPLKAPKPNAQSRTLAEPSFWDTLPKPPSN
jgi:hypothetical protein